MKLNKLYGPENSSTIDWNECHPLILKKNKKYQITTERDGKGAESFSFIVYHGPQYAPRIFYFVKELGKKMKQILLFKAYRNDKLYLSYWIKNGSSWVQVSASKMTIKNKKAKKR